VPSALTIFYICKKTKQNCFLRKWRKKKMQIIKNKVVAIAIAIFFTISMTASMMLLPNASAHSPAWDINTYAFVAVSPNPCGVGQTLRVNLWINMPTPTASTVYGDEYHNMDVIVTAPDGSKTTLGPFTSDDTGGTHTTFTPTTVGNYTFMMTFPGQTLTGIPPPPAGFSATSASFIGDYMLPSNSSAVTVMVQNAPVTSVPLTPLPTTYWNRPINAQNNNWYSIGGNWLGFLEMNFAQTGGYNGSENYNPYTTAPTTAHILWTKPIMNGGTIGGEFGGSETSNYYSTAQYEPRWAPIIMDGIEYYTEYPSSSTNPCGWAAVSLKTGQTIWTEDAPLCIPNPSSPANQTITPGSVTENPVEGPCSALRCGQILDFTSPNQYGALGYLWSVGTLASVAAQTAIQPGTVCLNMFDAWPGDYILSIVNCSSQLASTNGGGGGLTEDQNGDLIGYYVNYTAGTQTIEGTPYTSPANTETLECWNSTQNILYPGGYIPGHTAISWSWRPIQGAILNFQYGITWASPVPTTINGNPLLAINNASPTTWGVFAVDSGAVLLRTPQGGFFNDGFIYEAGYSMATGAQLWVANKTEPAYTLIASSGGSFPAGDGVFLEIPQGTETVNCYSMTTDKLLWGPIALPGARPYDSLGINAVIANGTAYVYCYGGDVYAFNLANGDIKWQYHTPSGGFESPYGYYSLWIFNSATVAGGELFVSEGHMYSPPLYHGCQELALNITNGNVVWGVNLFACTCAPAVVDGVLTTMSCYDNQVYGFGQGPTKTTVVAPDTGVTTGTPVTITGTVMDISAGSQQNAVAMNFPNGLPAVSDASMSQFMEAVYEQQPMPTNITGVPVTLTETDHNGNTYTIGTTTTSSMGTFDFNWTPPIEGNYTIVATFAGSNSYYGSCAETYVYANAPAATAAPTASPVSGFATTSDLMLGIAVIAIVVIIIGAVIVLLVLRKRP
jgi:outer membrane protein assembly factor BamB